MIKVGVIGLGYWGPNLVRVFSEQNERAAVSAVADLQPSRLKKISARYPGTKLFADAEDLIRSDVDAVVVATPLAHHFAIALNALRAGKHVLIEKPLTRTSAEAEILVAEAKARNLTLMVDHTFVFHPYVIHLQRMIASGDLGNLYYYDSQRINLGLFQPDTDVMWDLAVHDLSILDFLHDGQPSSVSAIGVSHLQGYPEDVAFITLRYPDNFVAHINVSWLSPVKVRQLLIGGSRRMVIYDDLAHGNKLKVYDAGVEGLTSSERNYQRRVDYRVGDMSAPYVSPKEPLGTLAAHFLNCIEGAESPRSGGDAGLRVVRILEAASESMNQDGRSVSIKSLSAGAQ